MQKISVFSKDNELDSMILFLQHIIKQKKQQKNECSEAMDHFGCYHLIAAESINTTATTAN